MVQANGTTTGSELPVTSATPLPSKLKVIWRVFAAVLRAGAPSERRKVAADPFTAVPLMVAVGLAPLADVAPLQPVDESERSAQARRATVNAAPVLTCFTTCEVPPVALKSVVAPGKVIVVVPAVAAALRVVVPELEPLSWSFPSLN